MPDAWLRYGNPWRSPLGDRFRVKFLASTRTPTPRKLVNEWVDTKDVLATPYDTPIPGYGGKIVNTLRLWQAKAVSEFDLGEFNEGDYVGAVEARARSENFTRVLYPNDNVFVGKQLRLGQDYFFCSATLQDVIRRYKKRYKMFDEPKGLRTFDRFAEKVAIQLNDTHPARHPELMRLLIDTEGLTGTRRGTSPRGPSATPITPCCPRQLSGGQSGSWGTCFRGTSDHLRNQSAVPRPRSRSSQATTTLPPDVDH